MKTHELKVWPRFFEALIGGIKTAEYRKNDRNFEAGDLLRLREYNPETKSYTGQETHCVILHVNEGEPIPQGYALLSITRANIVRPLGSAHEQMNFSEDDLGD